MIDQEHLQARLLNQALLQEAILRSMPKSQIELVKAWYIEIAKANDANMLHTDQPDAVLNYVQRLVPMTLQSLDQIAENAKSA